MHMWCCVWRFLFQVNLTVCILSLLVVVWAFALFVFSGFLYTISLYSMTVMQMQITSLKKWSQNTNLNIRQAHWSVLAVCLQQHLQIVENEVSDLGWNASNEWKSSRILWKIKQHLHSKSRFPFSKWDAGCRRAKEAHSEFLKYTFAVKVPHIGFGLSSADPPQPKYFKSLCSSSKNVTVLNGVNVELSVWKCRSYRWIVGFTRLSCSWRVESGWGEWVTVHTLCVWPYCNSLSEMMRYSCLQGTSVERGSTTQSQAQDFYLSPHCSRFYFILICCLQLYILNLVAPMLSTVILGGGAPPELLREIITSAFVQWVLSSCFSFHVL